MKRIFFLSVILLAFSAVSNSQTIDGSLKNGIKALNAQEKEIKDRKRAMLKELKELNGPEVSSKAKFQFAKDFPGVSVVQWERLDNFDEATFEMSGQPMSAFYDANAELVGTTSIKTFAELPAKARRILAEQYKDYKIGDILFFDDNEQNETDMILYNQQFEDRDSYFVELIKGNKEILVQVSMNGEVLYFTRLR